MAADHSDKPPARKRRAAGERPIVGWREWISLPDLGINFIKAKIDTGARTSALHAFKIKTFRRQGQHYARFYVHPLQRRRRPEILCEAAIMDERVVTSSNGEREMRFIVKTSLRMGQHQWPIELSLTNRDEMSFRVLLGRQALRRHLIVDPGRSYRLNKGKHRTPMTRERKDR